MVQLPDADSQDIREASYNITETTIKALEVMYKKGIVTIPKSENMLLRGKEKADLLKPYFAFFLAKKKDADCRVEYISSTKSGSQGWMRRRSDPISASLYKFKVLTN